LTAQRASLAANLAGFVIPPLLLNGVIFGLGWDHDTAPNQYLPPGWVVGTIWMLLFTAMGIARWLLVRAGTSTGNREARLVVVLAFVCMIYPLYTLGLRSDRIGLAGSVATAALAIWIGSKVARRSRAAAGLTGLVVAWLIYASVALARIVQTQS